MNIIKSIDSEIIKIKRTSVVYFCLISAVLIPLISLVEFLMGKVIEPTHHDPWSVFFVDTQDDIAVFLLPFFIILISTQLPQIEYKNYTWNQVFASPQPFSYIFISKFLIIQASVIVLLLLTLLLMALVGVIADFFNPELLFLETKLSLTKILKPYIIIYISTLGISTFQFWAGMRFNNFIFPIVIGISLWTLGTMNHSNLFFFSFPVFSVVPRYESQITQILWSSVAYCVIISFLTYIHLKIKTPTN